MPLCGSALSLLGLSGVIDTGRLLRVLGNLLVWSFRDGVSIVSRSCVEYALSIMPKFRTDPHFQLAVLNFW